MGSTRSAYRPTVVVEEALLEIASRSGVDIAVHRRDTTTRPHSGIIDALEAAGFVEKYDGPAGKGAYTELTRRGEQLLERITQRRHQEDEGRPLHEWNPLNDPYRRRPEQFADYAVRNAEAGQEPTTRRYYTDGSLMLLGEHPDPQRQIAGAPPIDAGPMTDPSAWTAVPMEPIGYLFDRARAVIAFSREGVYLSANAYEAILAHAGTPAEWYALSRTPQSGEAVQEDAKVKMVRCDAGGVMGVAWTTPYHLKKKTPNGIRRLLQEARTRGGESGHGAARRAS